MRVCQVFGVCLSGEIDMSSREELLRALVPLEAASVAMIDLSEVTFADSTLANAVARLLNTREARFGAVARLRIVGARPSIARLFRITRLDTRVELFVQGEPDAAAPSVAHAPVQGVSQTAKAGAVAYSRSQAVRVVPSRAVMPLLLRGGRMNG